MWKFQLFKNRKIVSERRSRTHSGLRYFGRLLSKSLGLKNCFQLLKELLSSLIAVACLLAAAAAASVTGSGKRDREEQNALTSFGSGRGKTSFPIAKEYPSAVAQCDRSLQTETARLWLGRGQRTTWAGIVTIGRNPAVSSVILCVSARSRPVSPLRCGTPS